MDKEQITLIAIEMVKKDGLINLSRRELCERAGIPDGSFPHVVGCTFSEFVESLKTLTDNIIIHPVVKSRADPTLRKDQILNVALDLAKGHGYHKITREAVAYHANVSAGLVSRYFNTMKQLRRAVMRAAIHREIPEIVAQGIANNDDHAKKAPVELKQKALELIANY